MFLLRELVVRMSQSALQEFKLAIDAQHSRNEARRIRTKVDEARASSNVASIRWPFELLQNALDAGPRAGSSHVTIKIHCESNKLTFQHDGAPFEFLDLAALLSGGSNKDYESDETTGRFGTGFLVTHVLAERATLRGLLQREENHEQFELILDRGGDEDAILENMESCETSIAAATPIADIAPVPSARFEYQITDESILQGGVEALRRAIPYLYSTRPSLGQIELSIEGHLSEVWSANGLTRQEVDGGICDSRNVYLQSEEGENKNYRIYRYAVNEASAASAHILVEDENDGANIVVPDNDAPRIYREYPLRDSTFLPINVVLDGRFDPDQERRILLMKESDRELIQLALEGAVIGVKHAFAEGWSGSHYLARVQTPDSVFNSADQEEATWWVKSLSTFAQSLAELPIVKCSTEFRPAVSADGGAVNFALPSLHGKAADDEVAVGEVWPLMEAAKGLIPPDLAIAADWTRVAKGWAGLGLKISRISIGELCQAVTEGAERLDQLAVDGDKTEWLARYLDVVGQCWKSRDGIELSVLGGIMPNQHEVLCSPAALSRDEGISADLKDICEAAGLDVRSRLLLERVSKFGAEHGLGHLPAVLEQSITSSLSESKVVEEIIDFLESELLDSGGDDEELSPLEFASLRLIDHLSATMGEEAAPLVQRIPLLTSTGKWVRWSRERMMMAPPACWYEAARPFLSAYPPDRVLGDIYADTADGTAAPHAALLVRAKVAYADPITTSSPAEIKERRLSAISEADTDGLIVRNEEFTQIALLQPEVLNRCQESVEHAKALLGLVLCHVAAHDTRWPETRTVCAKRSGEEVEIDVREALWIADLKVRSWVPVPVPGEDGEDEINKMPANEMSLRDLLDPAWLDGNDAAVRLLSECFEFDALELRLMGSAADPDLRQELRDGLASLLEAGGGDPQVYRELAQEIEARERRGRDVEKCKRLGLAVQEAVKNAVENYGLSLELIDRGFDYEVSLASDVVEDFAYRFKLGTYLDSAQKV